MHNRPKIITLDQIAEMIAETFKTKDEITCYVGSNAATPTASLTALTGRYVRQCLGGFYRSPAILQRGGRSSRILFGR